VVKKKDLFVAVLATFCLTATLFLMMPTRSQSPLGTYDPWVDLNGDESIDIYDAIILAGHFGTSGTPIAKASIQYDSGWLNITDKCGQYFNITHNLNSTDIMVDITGKTTIDGGTHQKYLGTRYQSGWIKTYAGAITDQLSYLFSIIQTHDGGYALAGHMIPSNPSADYAYLVRTDAYGNMLWNKTYGYLHLNPHKPLFLLCFVDAFVYGNVARSL